MRPFVVVTAVIATAAFAAPFALQRITLPSLFAPAAATSPLSDEQHAGLTADLAAIDTELRDATALAQQNGSTLVGALATARTQQLLLTRAMIDIRLRSARGEAAVLPTVAMVTPDPARAAQIHAEIKVVEAEIAAAQAEAARYSGGLVLAMIISREQTARLQLAQLKSGLYEAELGVPMTAAALLAKAPSATTAATPSVEIAPLATVEPAAAGIDRPEWADPDFPEIDYTDPTFAGLAREGMRMRGWWAISEVKAPIDDSLSVKALNVSAIKKGSLRGDVTLIARCQEGETALIFSPDTYLMSDYQSYSLPTIYRIDDQPPVSTNWGTLTSNNGVGLFGPEAIRFLQQIGGAQKLFLRVTEKNGQTHDAVFNLGGMAGVNAQINAACKWP